MITNIWLLSPTGRRRTSKCCLDYVTAEKSEVIPCPYADPRDHYAHKVRLSGLYLKVKQPISDFITDGWSNWLISERGEALFREHGITGFGLRPAKVLIVRRDRSLEGEIEEPEDRAWVRSGDSAIYHELLTTGWGGLVHPDSGVEPLGQCPGCGRTEYTPMTDPSKMFDENQWDGSDIFRIWPVGYPFVTAKVRELVEKHKLTGVKFLNLSEVEPEPTVFQGKNPHRGGLRWELEEPRASKIGKPLGIY